MEMQAAGKYIFIAGCLISIIGLILWLAGDKLSWIGNLPGDIKLNGSGYKFYFPLATSILISIVLSLVIWMVRKIFS